MKGDCNICINGKMPSYSATCVECGLSRKNYKPITNADRIRSMTDEELAEMMVYKDCPTIEMSLFNCPEKYCPDGETHDCHQCWLDWLKQEAVIDE